MLKKRIHDVFKLFSTLCFGILLASCVWDTDIPITNVSSIPDPASKGKIQFSYTGDGFQDAVDTIWVSGVVYFKSTVESKDFQVFVDDRLQVPLDNPDVTGFGFLITGLDSGPHRLRVREKSESGTKSLADGLGYEKVEFTFDFILYMQTSFTPQFRAIELKDGRVSISWVPYTGGGFTNYVLQIGDEQSGQIRDIAFNKQHQTTYVDSAFVGGRTTYRLTAYTEGGGGLTDPYILVDNYKPVFQLTALGDDHYRLNWNASDVVNNISSYELSIYNAPPLGQVDVAARAVEFNGTLSFGYDYNTSITARSDKGGLYGSAAYFSVGKKIPYYTQILHDPIKPIFYLYRQESTFGTDPTQNYPEGLFRIDDQTLDVIDSIISPMGQPSSARLVISPNGQYCYKLTKSIILRLDPASLSVISADSVIKASGGFFDYIDVWDAQLAVSNNNILIGSLDGHNYGTAVIDLTAHKFLLAEGDVHVYHISPDGKYLALDNALFTFDGTNFSSQINNASGTPLLTNFLNTNPSQLLILTDNALIIYDCDTKAQVESYPIAGFSYASHFDQYGQKLLVNVGRDDPRFSVFDLVTQTSTQLDTYGIVNFEGNALFKNSDILHSGYALKRF